MAGQLLTILNGKLRTDGCKGPLVLSASEDSPCCCKCKPCTIAHTVTNRNDESRRVWNLKPYKCAGVGCAGRPWRLIERGSNCGSQVSYGSGSVDEKGCLAGLPDEFTSNYGYDGYMYLELGCPDAATSETGETWPSCQDGGSCGCGECKCEDKTGSDCCS